MPLAPDDNILIVSTCVNNTCWELIISSIVIAPPITRSISIYIVRRTAWRRELPASMVAPCTYNAVSVQIGASHILFLIQHSPHAMVAYDAGWCRQHAGPSQVFSSCSYNHTIFSNYVPFILFYRTARRWRKKQMFSLPRSSSYNLSYLLSHSHHDHT